MMKCRQEWEHYIDLNDQLAEQWQDHIINQTEDPLPEAEEWAEITDKTDKLQIKWD